MLDPHRFGVAPRTIVEHDGQPYLTLAGLIERLHLSEDTIRRDRDLWMLGLQVSPRRRLWRADEVDALMASRRPAPKQQPLAQIRSKVKRLASITNRRRT